MIERTVQAYKSESAPITPSTKAALSLLALLVGIMAAPLATASIPTLRVYDLRVDAAHTMAHLTFQCTPASDIIAVNVRFQPPSSESWQDLLSGFHPVNETLPETGCGFISFALPDNRLEGSLFELTLLDRFGNHTIFTDLPAIFAAPASSSTRANINETKGTIPRIAGQPGDRIKTHIFNSGFYRLSAETIASSLSAYSEEDVHALIETTNLSVSCQGNNVAWLPDADKAALHFYAEATNSRFTAENIYWIDVAPGTIMSVVSNGAPSPAPENQTFWTTEHWEENLRASPLYYPNVEDDPYYWVYLRSWVSSQKEANLDFTTFTPLTNDSGYASGLIDLHMREVTVFTNNISLYINDTFVASNMWHGIASTTLTFSVTNLLSGSNVLKIVATSKPANYERIFIESFDVSYQRRYQAHDEALLCHADTNTMITVEGFASNDVVVLDLSNPFTPVLDVSATTTNTGSESYDIHFLSTEVQKPYCVASLSAAPPPPDIHGRTTAPLTTSTNRADHLTIAPAEYLSTATELVNYRNAQGLAAMLINVEDVFDLFSHGIRTPWAIRSFLQFAVENWDKPPRYAVLAGSGSYDYRNDQGLGDCQIPSLPIYVSGGQYITDAPLASWDGDKAPEIALGRLHCQTTQELAGAIAKIKNFETDGHWKHLAHMIADEFDPSAGDFAKSSDLIATNIPIPRYQIDRNFYDTQTVSEVQSRIIDTLNTGAYFISYYGHGNPSFLNDSILHVRDLPSLTNATAPSIMCALTCAFTYFGTPGIEFLGEGLIGRNSSGVAALWGAVAITFNSASEQLGLYLTEAIFQNKTIRLGDAILSALNRYEDAPTFPFVLDVMNLPGDPATALPPPGYSFGSWQQYVFSESELGDPETSGPLADPDGDGQRNLLEFAVGSSPTNSTDTASFTAWISQHEPTPGTTNDYATAQYRQRQWREGYESSMEACTNLLNQTWFSDIGTIEHVETTPIDDVFEEVTVRLHPELLIDREFFIRLRVRKTN